MSSIKISFPSRLPGVGHWASSRVVVGDVPGLLQFIAAVSRGYKREMTATGQPLPLYTDPIHRLNYPL